MKFELEEYNRNISSQEMIDDLQKVAKKLNKKSVTISEYEEFGKFHPHSIQNRFHSWNNSLKEANLEINREVNISDEDLFRNIENVWITLGRQPRYTEIKKPISQFSTKPYETRFGTWRKALEAFVLYINSDEEAENENHDSISKGSKNNSETVKFVHKTKRDISERLRFKILMRDGFTCKKCGRSPMKEMGVELHVDHIIPWSKGGETIPENLETKCKECNLGKGNAFNV